MSCERKMCTECNRVTLICDDVCSGCGRFQFNEEFYQEEKRNMIIADSKQEQ